MKVEELDQLILECEERTIRLRELIAIAEKAFANEDGVSPLIAQMLAHMKQEAVFFHDAMRQVNKVYVEIIERLSDANVKLASDLLRVTQSYRELLEAKYLPLPEPAKKP
jgi:hypothetical protein